MQSNWSVNFLSPQTSIKKTKKLTFFKILFFTFMIFNMSLSGVFLVIGEALACHGYITIVKVAENGENIDFNFSASGPEAPANFTLKGGESIYFGRVQGGNYFITETETAGWDLKSITCTGDPNYQVYLDEGKVKIDLDHDEHVNCIFVNQTEHEPICGDGILHEGEMCDDGNDVDGDGCSSDCNYELKKVPVNTCTGDGVLYLYQFEQEQPIKTSFTVNHNQVLIFARANASLSAEVNGVAATMTEVASQSFAKIYSINTNAGDNISVNGTHPDNARGVQAYLAQNSSAPVYDLSTIQVVIDDTRTNDMYLTPGNYSYVFFDKYSNTDSGSDDSRLLSVEIASSTGVVHSQSYNKPNPVPTEGVVVNSYSINSADTYTLSVDTEDSMYWLYSECSKKPECGDGVVDTGEICDDGNNVDNDACNNECKPQGELIIKKFVIGGTATSSDWDMEVDGTSVFLGDPLGQSLWLTTGNHVVTESPAISHYGLTYASDCNSRGVVAIEYNKTKTCELTNTYEPFCGDYNIDNGEECDDGPNGSNTCTADCKTIPDPKCGDGKVDAGEMCDDGNNINDDECSNSCEKQGKILVKKFVSGGEATSSDFTMLVGNALSFPGSVEGTINWVPVGMYQIGETPALSYYNLTFSGDCSESGMASVSYNATTTCELTNTYEPFCGDYNINPGEECDDGPNGSNTCTADCKLIPFCGDFNIDPGEECDDGPNGSPFCTADCKSIEQCTSSISGKKLDFFSKSGLTNWVIEVAKNDIFYATTTTDSNGDYNFDNLCTGKYVISEHQQTGWTQTFPANPYTHTVYITTKNTKETGKNFINRHEVGSLKICKIEDEDGSLGSTRDQSYVADWPFFVEVNNATSTYRTATSGCVVINNLLIGDYKIYEEQLAGWIILSPSSGETIATVEAGQEKLVEFYNQRYGNQGKICGYKFEDKDNNPQTANILGLPNWTIELNEAGNCNRGEEWADTVVSYSPGLESDGSDVNPGANDPQRALGEAQLDYTANAVSLGFGGEIVLEFTNLIFNGAGADIDIFETSASSADPINNPEKVKVYASQSGAEDDYLLLGEANLDSSLDLGSLAWARYIKLVDTSDPNDFTNDNGYDLDGIRANYCRSDWNVVDTTTTDDNGYYCFYGLKYNDNYRVNENLKPNWINTTPLALDVMLSYTSEVEEFYNFNNYYQPEDEPFCGDYNVDPGEACDDGPNGSATCTADCSTKGGGGGGGRVSLSILDVEASCVSSSSVEIKWRTNKTSMSWVSFHKDSDLLEDADIVNSSTDSQFHAVTVDGLEPYVDYSYQVNAQAGSDKKSKTVTYNTDACVQVKGEEGEPILQIIKDTPTEFAKAGDKNVEFTVVVTNVGDLTSFNTMIEDLLPDGMLYSDDQQKERTWAIGDLEPGQSYNITYTVDIADDVDPSVLENVANTYSDNHDKVLDSADVEILEVLVETGFNPEESLFLMLALLFSAMAAMYLRKKLS
jgi:uncharacterized repeat protein (TIGR01451 family)